MPLTIGRRELIAALGGAAAAWPLAARAQQPVLPVMGVLGPGSPQSVAHLLAVFRQSLADAGFAEGRNVAIRYHFTEGRYDQLPTMAAELVRDQTAVIVAPNTVAALAAKAATATIPIVFGATDDPVKLGLVADFARPGGNATGVYFFLSDLAAKQLGLLRELVPATARIGVMLNPENANAESVTREVMAAAAAIGVQIDVVRASDSGTIEAGFATLVRDKADALLVGADPFFFSRRVQLATLATRHALPAIYNVREFPEVGGLMSYGTRVTEMWRQLGVYAAGILKGAKPSDLPVVQPTKFEFLINLPTARALGIEIPPTLLARADEVIE
jgi:putative ABC transport system substrate-binding protein